MPEKQDIASIARHWVKRYGDEALDQLNQRLSELRDHDEVEAHALWMKILKEVQLLVAEK